MFKKMESEKIKSTSVPLFLPVVYGFCFLAHTSPFHQLTVYQNEVLGRPLFGTTGADRVAVPASKNLKFSA